MQRPLEARCPSRACRAATGRPVHRGRRCPRAEARCRIEAPALRDIGAGHRTACHEQVIDRDTPVIHEDGAMAAGDRVIAIGPSILTCWSWAEHAHWYRGFHFRLARRFPSLTSRGHTSSCWPRLGCLLIGCCAALDRHDKEPPEPGVFRAAFPAPVPVKRPFERRSLERHLPQRKAVRQGGQDARDALGPDRGAPPTHTVWHETLPEGATRETVDSIRDGMLDDTEF
jgi:hypothetical protein